MRGHAPAGTRLLIVDDHPVNLAMLKRQLKVLGLEADTATSGLEALAKWRRERHNLVITDLQMPEMDGYAFARAIRAEQDQGKQPKPTVVAFTANTHSEALEQCMDAGMDDYLTKPAELLTLRAKLAEWLGSEAPPTMAPSARPASAPRVKSDRSCAHPAPRRRSTGHCRGAGGAGVRRARRHCRSAGRRSRAATAQRCGAPRIASRVAR